MTARLTTKQRGYAGDHVRLKRALRPVVDAGDAYCCEVVCINPGGRWIRPGSPWHLAHATGQNGYRGPAHADCNLAEVAQRRSKPKAAKRKGIRWRSTQMW